MTVLLYTTKRALKHISSPQSEGNKILQNKAMTYQMYQTIYI